MSAVHPSELELQVLKVLWDAAPRTAREIRDELAARGRDLAYTSVITTVQRMVDKKLLKQLEPIEGKAFRFEPKVTDQQVTRSMLGEFVDRVFDGSAEAVVMSLFAAKELDPEAIKRLRRAFNQKLKEQGDD